MTEPSGDGASVFDSLASPENGPPQLQPIRSRRVPVMRQNGVQQVVRVNGNTNHRTPATSQDSRNSYGGHGRSNSGGSGYHNYHAGHRNGYQPQRNGSPNYRHPRDSGIPQTQRPKNFSISDHQREPVRRPLEPWKSWPELSVKVSNLPLETTTLDLYNLFNKYGTIEMIDLMESSRGVRDGSGRIRFCPPPKEAFWDKQHKIFRNKRDQTPIIMGVKLEEPRRLYNIRSPVTKKALPEKFRFPCNSIEFGFMYEQFTMMSMFETMTGSEMSFEVNLRKRFVIVSFTHQFHDPPDLPTGTEKHARTDKFKFEIPFTSLESIYEDPESTVKDRIFIISLPAPPSFWKQVHAISKTHDDGKYWSDRNTWFRQTDIVYNHSELRTQPVAIKKKKPLIDLGRWTTYRITFNLDDEKWRHDFIPMMSALRDFNVKIESFDNFTRQSDHRARIWDVIDRPVGAGPGSFAKELEELEGISSHRSLPFPLRYQLEVCISEGRLSEYNLTREFVDRLLEMEEKQKGTAVRLLEVVAETEIRYYNPMDIFGVKVTRDPKIGMPAYCSVMRKATITPTMVYFSTPSVETSNRVLRQYQEHSDRFLRIQFTDERGHGKVSANDDNTTNEVYTRAKRALSNGITIGERHFEFLAFGNSQLREHGAYFFASTDHLTAADIRKWMGEFAHIRQVAKHAARLGQCFSTTFSINTVKANVREIPDIEHDGHCFSDGCGLISEFVSQMIGSELGLLGNNNGHAPSAYQFRLGGSKGVLAASPLLSGRDVCIRPSQRKFNTSHTGLEIIRSSQLAASYLNRQLIVVLKTLEVEDHVFMRKLKNQLKDLETAMADQSVALGLLRKHIDPNQATLHIAGLILSGFFKSKEPFLLNLLSLWRAWSIKALKEKARIVIEEGAFLIGVVDETAKLKGHYDRTSEQEDSMSGQQKLEELPEIFLQISDNNSPSGFRVIEGTCLLARNPSLHPGDMRVVKAVKCQELMHLRNVVVLPQTGTTPLASMCSGGDLDGDDYVVIWDQEFVPNIVNHTPMDYTPPKPSPLEREVSVADITSFFVNYMKMDKLGTIAHSHLAWADFFEEGVKADKCIRLAELHSMAVDFNKTGDPAIMEKDLRVRRWPHFMEKFLDNPEKTRISNKILGKLYDAVQKIAFVPQYEHSFDPRILNAFVFDRTTIQLAKIIKKEYDWAMRRIMGQHAIQTEFEVYSTFVMSHSGVGSDYKYHEEIGQIRDGLKDRFKKVIVNALGKRDEATLGRFAVAMYQITSDEYSQYKIDKTTAPKGSSPPLISFPWLFHELLGKVADGAPPFDGYGNFGGVPTSYESNAEQTPISLANDETIAAFFAEKQSMTLEYEVDTSSQSSRLSNPRTDKIEIELEAMLSGSKTLALNGHPDSGKDGEPGAEGGEVNGGNEEKE